MNRYHNQELINEKFKAFLSLSEHEQVESKKFIEMAYQMAKFNFEKISGYTAPEEIERRTNVYNYYFDLIEKIKGE